MTWIPPLLVAIPLLTAAAVAGGDHVTPQPVQKALAILGSAAVLALALVLMLAAETHEVVHWFSGWRPRSGVVIGIDFAVDPLSAAMCAVIATVVLLALVYSWTYMKEAARLYDALILAALGAMCGFAMSGDIFNLFVWLELTGVCAYALTGFKVEQLGPLQGAVNFAIVNTIGGYLFAIGIALVYARTGALNLAQIGHTLSGHGGSGLAIVAMTLIFAGLLTKGALVPFHLWAADAYAVAPAPVGAIFGGVMTDIGLIGVARIYWTVFDAPFGAHKETVGHLLLWVGIVTALLGGVMALLQRHLKRMLAYSVICHIGIMLAGIGLLASKGLAGTGVMFVSHAFLTAALFFTAGALLARHGSIDELVLRGRGAADRGLAVIWFAGALGLAGIPYVGTYLGHALIDEAASDGGRHWVQPLLWLSGALASAALLRAGGRIFLGLGSPQASLLGPHLEEEPVERDVAHRVLVAVGAVAVAAGIAVSVVPGIGQRAVYGADRFRLRTEYAARILHDVPMKRTAQLPYAVRHTTLESLLYGVAAPLLALGLAGIGLRRRRRPDARRALRARVLEPTVAVLKGVHSGVVGDYVMWLIVGTAVFGGVWALALR